MLVAQATFASLFDLQEISQGSLQEVAEIKELTAILKALFNR